VYIAPFLAAPLLILLLIYMFIVTRHRKQRARAWKHIREEMKM
jgi:preprotein translocase subunit YajC